MLRECLAYHLGADLFDLAEPALTELGRVMTEPDVLALGARAEREVPRLVGYAPWGERVDDIEVSAA